MPQLSMQSPAGAVSVAEDDDGIVSVDWGWARDQTPTALLRRAVEQLQDFFDGSRTVFELPLSPRGSRYQMRVWQAVVEVPFGTTIRYGRLSDVVGGCARSVGQAIGRNPLPILVPCHRVVGARSIGGAGAEGLGLKRFLLRLEGHSIHAEETE